MTPERNLRSAATQRANKTAKLAARLDDIRAWVAQGITRLEIAARLPCGRQTLRTFMHEYGIEYAAETPPPEPPVKIAVIIEPKPRKPRRTRKRYVPFVDRREQERQAKAYQHYEVKPLRTWVNLSDAEQAELTAKVRGWVRDGVGRMGSA